jgi:hypothetical protein
MKHTENNTGSGERQESAVEGGCIDLSTMHVQVQYQDKIPTKQQTDT